MRARDASGRTPIESARLRLDAPQRGGNGGGVGSVVGRGGGRGGGRLGDLPAPAGARRRRGRRCLRWCGVNSGIVNACGGGVSLCSGRRTERDKKIKKKSLPSMAADR